jgi:hypothetical protein
MAAFSNCGMILQALKTNLENGHCLALLSANREMKERGR